MNVRLGLRIVYPVPVLLALFLLAPTVCALGADDVFFFDDFNGSAVDATKWETAIAVTGIRYMNGEWTLPPAETNYGTVTLADSRLSLDNPSPTLSCPIFPLIWTNKAIPPTGNFELEFRMRYTAGGFWGDGVRIVRMPSAFEPAAGSKDSAAGDFVLMIHQDNFDCKGPNVSVPGHPGEDGSSLPFNTDWHTYTLRYEGGASTVYVDSAYFAGPLPTPRPNCIQLGVGEVKSGADSCAAYGCRWTSYTIDFIRVRPLGTTPTRPSSWGELKARYR